MVGYSRLIGLDDRNARTAAGLRRNLIDPAIEEHGGRIVQTGGDSLLIVFDSIDGAVRCAVKVQQQVPIHDGDQPPDRAIRFRVGINIGDAIADGTDLHGDGVNVAARLQAECPPGGICVSRAVRDHVHGRLDLAFEELGTLDLKNIARPVEAFVLRLRCRDARSVERSYCKTRPKPCRCRISPRSLCWHLTNMSGDPTRNIFRTGIADDIITELVAQPFAVCHRAQFQLHLQGPGGRCEAGRARTGCALCPRGQRAPSGGAVRVTAQLIDANRQPYLGGTV